MGEVKKYEQKDIATAMIQNALDKGLDVSTIEKLLELRDKITKEQARQMFIEALATFQNKLGEIPKDKAVYNKDGSIRYKYASYDKIISTIKPVMAECGLAFRFESSVEKNQLVIHCIIQHVAGHSETTSFYLPIDTSPHMSPIQQYGSTLTYARRYALCLALGLATEEDTDAVDDREEKVSEAVVQSYQQSGDTATESQIKAIYAIMHSKGIKDENKHQMVSSILGKDISSLKELSKKEASQVIDALKQEPF